MIKDHLLLHFIVFIYGLTAIIGKLMTIQGGPIVWHRTWIATLCLFIYLKFNGRKIILPFKDMLVLTGIGLIVGAHWVLFFQAIKESNVSITLACLSSTTIMAAFMEPILFRRKPGFAEIFTGIIIISSISVIFQIESLYTTGMIMGLASAFLASLFTVINKKIAGSHSGEIVSFYEMAGGFIGVSIFYTAIYDGEFNLHLNASDFLLVFFLGSVCTAFAFAATMRVLERLSAYTVILAINLEPVYGILMAAMFFREYENLSYEFYVGATIMLITVVSYSLLKESKKLSPEIVRV